MWGLCCWVFGLASYPVMLEVGTPLKTAKHRVTQAADLGKVGVAGGYPGGESPRVMTVLVVLGCAVVVAASALDAVDDVAETT